MSQSAQPDPLLTSLCAVCHIQTPRYKCPACALRTCSLPCIRKHKARSSCSGARDPTAYIAPSKLKTPAGVDHDFNFLSGIERAVQRSERDIVEDRGLLTKAELRPQDVHRVKWRRQKDGSMKKFHVRDPPRPDVAAVRPLPKQMKRRLATLGINVIQAPTGMARQKQNETHVQRSSGRIRWQVEWVLLQHPTAATDTDIKTSLVDVPVPTRIMGKSMDTSSLHTAFSGCWALYLDALQRSQGGADSAEEKPNHVELPPYTSQSQDPDTSSWLNGWESNQEYPHSAWSQQNRATVLCKGGNHGSQVADFRFFIPPSPHARSPDNEILLRPAQPTASLAESLRDITVLEFPTIYVLPIGSSLPATFVVAPPCPPKQPIKRQRAETEPASNDPKPDEGRPYKRPFCRDNGKRILHNGSMGDESDAPEEAAAGGTYRAETTSSSGSESDSNNEDVW